MGSSKINRAAANRSVVRITIDRAFDRHHLIATTRDGDEPAYRSRAAPQLGVGLHRAASRAKRATLASASATASCTRRAAARAIGRRAHRATDHEHVGARGRDLRRRADARLIVTSPSARRTPGTTVTKS